MCPRKYKEEKKQDVTESVEKAADIYSQGLAAVVRDVLVVGSSRGQSQEEASQSFDTHLVCSSTKRRTDKEQVRNGWGMGEGEGKDEDNEESSKARVWGWRWSEIKGSERKGGKGKERRAGQRRRERVAKKRHTHPTHTQKKNLLFGLVCHNHIHNHNHNHNHNHTHTPSHYPTITPYSITPSLRHIILVLLLL